VTCSYHYSEKIFSGAVMIAGGQSMPSPTGGTIQGKTGDGYAKIILLAETEDTQAPKVSFAPRGNTAVATGHTTIVTVTDNGGSALNESSLKYLRTSDTSRPDASDFITGFTNNQQIEKSDGDGTRYLRILAMDNAGNTTIESSSGFPFDNTAPTGSISINNGAAYTTATGVQVTLTTDDTKATICISNTDPCTSQRESYKTSYSHTLPQQEGEHTVYVRFKDNVGNTSVAYTGTIILDMTKPTGSISINTGATYTTGATVTLTLTQIGATDMCISNTALCSTREQYTGTSSRTLNAPDGNKTVYVTFKDEAGNLSPQYTGAIILDTIAPTGTLTYKPSTGTRTSGTVIVTLQLSETLTGTLPTDRIASGTNQYVKTYTANTTPTETLSFADLAGNT
jgi:hypothetical protein